MGTAPKPTALAAKVTAVMPLKTPARMPSLSAANPVETVPKVAPKEIPVAMNAASTVTCLASPILVINTKHAAPRPRADLRKAWTVTAQVNRHADLSLVLIAAQHAPRTDLAWQTAIVVAVDPRPMDAIIAALIVTLAT
jgi:hypothetical protein